MQVKSSKVKGSLMCHQCQRNDKSGVVHCSLCKAKRFCYECIERWWVVLVNFDLDSLSCVHCICIMLWNQKLYACCCWYISVKLIGTLGNQERILRLLARFAVATATAKRACESFELRWVLISSVSLRCVSEAVYISISSWCFWFCSLVEKLNRVSSYNGYVICCIRLCLCWGIYIVSRALNLRLKPKSEVFSYFDILVVILTNSSGIDSESYFLCWQVHIWLKWT